MAKSHSPDPAPRNSKINGSGTPHTEYREQSRLGAGLAETVVDPHRRLTAVVERLGGSPLPLYEPQSSASKHSPSAEQKLFRPDAATLAKLEERFLALHGMSDDPQARGLHFERLLADLFNAWGMNARGSFALKGEQIDGSFLHGNFTYLLEAKWHRAKTDAATLRGFQGKIDERNEWTRGLFVSYSGYAREFEGMTRTPVPLDTLLATRLKLVADLQSRLDDKAKQFLLTLQDGEPDFAALNRPQAADLPAVKWKLLNLNKLKRDNPEKHAAQRDALLKLLG